MICLRIRKLCSSLDFTSISELIDRGSWQNCSILNIYNCLQFFMKKCNNLRFCTKFETVQFIWMKINRWGNLLYPGPEWNQFPGYGIRKNMADISPQTIAKIYTYLRINIKSCLTVHKCYKRNVYTHTIIKKNHMYLHTSDSNVK